MSRAHGCAGAAVFPRCDVQGCTNAASTGDPHGCGKVEQRRSSCRDALERPLRLPSVLGLTKGREKANTSSSF